MSKLNEIIDTSKEKLFEVICIDNIDREEDLTIGNTYSVFDMEDVSGINDLYYLTILNNKEWCWEYHARFNKK